MDHSIKVSTLKPLSHLYSQSGQETLLLHLQNRSRIYALLTASLASTTINHEDCYSHLLLGGLLLPPLPLRLHFTVSSQKDPLLNSKFHFFPAHNPLIIFASLRRKAKVPTGHTEGHKPPSNMAHPPSTPSSTTTFCSATLPPGCFQITPGVHIPQGLCSSWSCLPWYRQVILISASYQLSPGLRPTDHAI